MSKLKIIKNRLRSSLSDDTMSALMIMAAESDLLQNLSNADIIIYQPTAWPLQAHLSALDLWHIDLLNKGNLRLRDGLAMEGGY